MPLGALVVNRVHRASSIRRVSAAARERLAAGGADARLLADLLEQHEALERLAGGERDRIAELAGSLSGVDLVQVPLLGDDVHDLAGLRRLGVHLFDGQDARPATAGGGRAATSARRGDGQGR
jgi:hypothetical protein